MKQKTAPDIFSRENNDVIREQYVAANSSRGTRRIFVPATTPTCKASLHPNSEEETTRVAR